MTSQNKRWRVKSRQQSQDEINLVSELILNNTQKEVAKITGFPLSKVKNIIYRHTIGAELLRLKHKKVDG